jgi:uncharacterized protein (TIGR02145 family)
MKLQELAAPKPSKQIAKVFESYFGSRIRFDQLSRNQTRTMLIKVQGVLKEHRGTTARHRSETNPKYLQLVMMEQALAAAATTPPANPQQQAGMQAAQIQQKKKQIQDAIKAKQAEIADLQKQVELLSLYTSLLASGLVDIDGNNYPVVKIGNQIWMKENLRVRKYNDGTAIPFDASGGTAGNGSGFTWGGLTYGAHTLYAHDSTATPSNLTKYGYLYNWYAAKGIATTGSTTYKNICPSGWRVPTDGDFNTLAANLNVENIAGGTMKSPGTVYWNSPNTSANNSSGFSALPGGSRSYYGNFSNLRIKAVFWTTTVYNSVSSWFHYLSYNDGLAQRQYSYFEGDNSLGASVRCLKN